MSIEQHQPRNKQSGSSFIEILISLLMISIGILGLVTTQLNTLTNNREAYFRTQATVLAYDIIDRMRANREQALTNSYSVALGNTNGSVCATACSPTQIATTDITQWKGSISNQLPSGDGSVSAIAGVEDSYSVIVQWLHNNGETMSLDVRMRL